MIPDGDRQARVARNVFPRAHRRRVVRLPDRISGVGLVTRLILCNGVTVFRRLERKKKVLRG